MDVKKIKNIIFDLGRVLFIFDPEAYVENEISEEKRVSFLKEVFESPEWLMLDRGTLNYEKAKKIFKKRLPDSEKEIDEFFDEKFFDMLIPIEKNIKLLPKLKEKYNLYILSNYHKESFEEMNRRYSFFSNFDGHVVSCYYHQLKPEKEIYETIINKFSLNPEETVFIDDFFANIEMSEKMGIKGIHLPDYNELEKKLSEFLK